MNILERILDLKNTFEGKCLAVLIAVMLCMSCVSLVALADNPGEQTSGSQVASSDEGGAGVGEAVSPEQPAADEAVIAVEPTNPNPTQDSASDVIAPEPTTPVVDETVLSDEALITIGTQHAYVTVKDQILESSTLKTVLHEKFEFSVSADTGYLVNKVEAKNGATQEVVVLGAQDGFYTVAAEHVDSNLVINVSAIADQTTMEEAKQATTVPLTDKSVLGRAGGLDVSVLLNVGETATVDGSATGEYIFYNNWSIIGGKEYISLKDESQFTVSVTGVKAGFATLEHAWATPSSPNNKDTDTVIIKVVDPGSQNEYGVSYTTDVPWDVSDVTNMPDGETRRVQEEVTVSASIPVCEGYAFAGWSYDNATLLPGEKFTMPQKDVELKAQWLPESQAIKYLSNNSDWGAVSRSGEATSKTGTILGSTAIANEGYRFVGWFSQLDTAGQGAGASLTSEATFVPTGRNAAVYYAVFEPVQENRTALTIAADDSEGLVYNSQYQTWHEWTLADGALKAGDEIEVVFSADSKIKDASSDDSGQYPNVVENSIDHVKITRNGVEVTGEYDITFISGELTMAKASAKIHAPSARKYYDGTPLSCYSLIGKYGVANGGLDGSDVVIPVSGVFATGIWTEGIYDKDFNYINGSVGIIREPDTKGNITNVFDSREAAVTDWTHGPVSEITKNYNAEFVTGLLEIIPRPITITANSLTNPIPYDGNSHELRGYTVSGMGLADGDVLYPRSDSDKVSISGTEPGEYILDPSTVGFRVYDGPEMQNRITGNYVFTYVPGSMTISAPEQLPEITLQAKSATVTYDGSEKSVEGLNSNTFEYQGATYTVEANVSAYGVDFVDGGYPTKQEGEIIVRDDFGNEVKNKFDIAIEPGRLMIERREVIVKASDDSKEYDGKPLVASKYEVLTSTDDTKGLISGHSLTAKVSGSQTAVGSSPSSIVPGSVAISLSDGGTVETSNYTIRTAEGTLTVKHNANNLVLTVEANSFTKTYDGSSVEVTGVKYNGGDVTANNMSAKLTIDGETYTVSGMSATASGTDVADSKRVEVVGNLEVWDSHQKNVTDQFNVVKKPGHLMIEQRKVVVTANDNPVSIPFDFKEHTLSGYTVSERSETEGIVSGETLAPPASEVSISGTEEGVYTLDPRNFDFTVEKANGASSTDNYAFDFKTGSMTISEQSEKPEVTLRASSGGFVYNGEEQTVQGFEDGGSFTYEGKTYKAEADISAQRKDIGESATELRGEIIIRDETGVDVSSRFEISYIQGRIQIEQRKVFVKAADGYKDFDNTPLLASGYDVLESSSGDDGLVGEHVLTAEVSGSQTLPGSSASTVVEGSVAIVDSSGANVSENYSVKGAEGLLTVGHSAENLVLDVTAKSGSHIYNGTEQTVSGVTYNGVEAASDSDSIELVIDGETFTVSGMSASASGINVADSTTADVLGTCTILDAAGVNQTSKFTINKKSGDLTIVPRSVEISAASAEKSYDGAPLTDSRWFAEQAIAETESGLLGSGDILSVIVSGSQTLPGSSANIPSGAVFAQGMAENYKPAYVAGTLTVRDNGEAAQRVINITANSNTVTYNGSEQTVEGLTYNGSTSASVTFDGVTYEVSGLSARASGTSVGTYPTAFDGRVVVTDPSENNVTNMFTINQELGSLVIEAVPLTITAASGQKVYDGVPLTNSTYTAEGLLEGDGISAVSVVGSQTEVGSSANVVSQATVQRDGVAVTENYSVTYGNGTLEVFAVAPAPTTPVTPLPTPDNPANPATPAPANPIDAIVQPVAETLANIVETVINPNATPQAGTGNNNEEVAVDENGTPLGLADHDPSCWVHYYIILGIILTLAYGLSVIVRRRKFIGDLNGIERTFLDANRQTRNNNEGRNA